MISKWRNARGQELDVDGSRFVIVRAESPVKGASGVGFAADP